MSTTNYVNKYRTVYFDDDMLDALLEMQKENDHNISKTIQDLMKDGLKYRTRISDGDYIKKGE